MLFAQFDVYGRFSQVESTLWADLWCPQFAFLRWSHFQESCPYIWIRELKGLKLCVRSFQVVALCVCVCMSGGRKDMFDCISGQMPRSQISWKTLESPGSNQRHLASRKILRFINSAKSSTVDLRYAYKTDGSLVNFRRMPFQSMQKTTEDVENGHLKECQAFDVDLHCNTFKIRFRAVYTQAYGGACRRDRTRKTHGCQRGHYRLFFWGGGPRKRGVRPHPPNPLAFFFFFFATCLGFTFRPCAFFSMFLVTFFSPNLRGRAEKNKLSKEKKTHWLSVPVNLTDKWHT